MTVVALSAAYGAAGGMIGCKVAERLGVRFLDRAIPTRVSTRRDVPFDVADLPEETLTGSRLERMLMGFLGGDPGLATPVPADVLNPADFRRATEEEVLACAAKGQVVILGRGAVAVLRHHPGVLRVRLGGAPERRVAQAMRLQGIDEERARRAMRRIDKTQATYFKQHYGIRADDISLYQLVIDSTVLEIDTCVDMIASAAQSLTS